MQAGLQMFAKVCVIGEGLTLAAKFDAEAEGLEYVCLRQGLACRAVADVHARCGEVMGKIRAMYVEGRHGRRGGFQGKDQTLMCGKNTSDNQRI